MSEPSIERLPSVPSRLIAATRPGFLAAAIAPALAGIAAGSRSVSVDWGLAILTVVGVVLAHAGINVINDVHDHHSGSDEANDDRIFPFTGGSRMIQNGVLSVQQMTQLGWALLAVSALIGLALLSRGGIALALIGIVGLTIGWAYSAPPLRLCGRGLGEVSVAIGFGVLVPLGAALVQTTRLEPAAAWAGASYAPLIAAVLLVNQLPDLRADAATGKRNLVVRLGPRRAVWIYAVLIVTGYATTAIAVGIDALPALVLVSWLSAPLHLSAAFMLPRALASRTIMLRSIRLTLAAALLHALLMAGSLGWV